MSEDSGLDDELGAWLPRARRRTLAERWRRAGWFDRVSWALGLVVIVSVAGVLAGAVAGHAWSDAIRRATRLNPGAFPRVRWAILGTPVLVALAIAVLVARGFDARDRRGRRSHDVHVPVVRRARYSTHAHVSTAQLLAGIVPDETP